MPDDVRDRASDVPWRQIIAMRNAIGHGYFEADVEIAWKTVKLDLPPLQEELRGLLAETEP